MKEIKEHRIATSPGEAVAMLNSGPGKGRFIAGGTGLQLLNEKCDFVVDINHAGLDGIESSQWGDVLVGAATPLRQCSIDESLNGYAGGEISRVAGQCANLAKGSMGGNLCLALPSAEMAPVLMALDATCIILDEESQESLLLSEFFVAPRETVLENRLLAGVILSAEASHWRCQSFKLVRSAEDAALVQVAVALDVQEGIIKQARIALGAVAPVPMRCHLAEQLLADQKLSDLTPDLVDNVAMIAASECNPDDDDLASAEYRIGKVQALTRRMICRALAEEGPKSCENTDNGEGDEGPVA